MHSDFLVLMLGHLRLVGLEAGVHLMAHAAVVLAHGDEESFELRALVQDFKAHSANDHLGFLACLGAESFVGDGHKFLGVHIPDHGDRGVLGRLVAVVVTLPVVALAADKGLGVDVAAQVDRHPGGEVFDQEGEVEPTNRGVPGFQDLMLPGLGGRVLRGEADGGQGALLNSEPVRLGWVLDQFDVHVSS